MAKKKKKMPGLNTSSTADISFMLLIFFLITTSMDTDKGLKRVLPEMPDEEQPQNQQIHERNILYIMVNAGGKLKYKDGKSGELRDMDKSELRQYVKDFIENENNDENWPEVFEKSIDELHISHRATKHIISLQTAKATRYEEYFFIQNELVAAYNELREQCAKDLFKCSYDDLPKAKQDGVREIYKLQISEAEPKKYKVE